MSVTLFTDQKGATFWTETDGHSRERHRPMTDDVRQAAERLRSASYTGPLHEVPLAMVEDLVTLRDAVLPYLDSEPVDEEWLRSVGFNEHYSGAVFMCGGLRVLVSESVWSFGLMDIPSPKTRGEVRAVCKLLGVPINERRTDDA